VFIFKDYSLVRVAKVLIITVVFMLCLGAVKFFPTIEFLHQHPRHIYDYSGFSLNSLYFGLFSHDQTLNAIEKLPIEEHGFVNGVTGAMDENGMYIGVIPFLLFILGIGLHDKRRFYLFLCLLIFLWISFGNRPRLELWSLLHLLPVYNSMRVAQRFRIVFMLCLAALAGFGFQNTNAFLKRNIANPTVTRFISSGILVFVLGDLLATNSLVFKDAFPIPPLPVTKNEQFYQVWDFPAYNKDGWINPDAGVDSDPFTSYNPYGRFSSFGSLYPTFLSNIGTINGYETAEVPRNAVPVSSDNYQGEVYLAGTAGSVDISSWSPNEVIVNVQAASEGFVVLNQNYYSGWKVKGESERKPEDKNGLLAVKISPADRQLELYYLPTSFIIGSIVTGVTILLCGFLLFGLTQTNFLRSNHHRKIIIDTVRTNIAHAVGNLSLGKSGLQIVFQIWLAVGHINAPGTGGHSGSVGWIPVISGIPAQIRKIRQIRNQDDLLI
jgi:hypothetical protein